MTEIKKILTTDEKVLWEGTPTFLPFVLGRSASMFLLGLFLSCFIYIFTTASPLFKMSPQSSFFLLPFFIFTLCLMFGPLLYNIFVFKHIYYAITDKRVLLQRGLLARSFDIIDRNQITSTQVVSTLFNKLFDPTTGSIFVSTAGAVVYMRRGVAQRPYIISSIKNPYEISKLLATAQSELVEKS